MDLTRYIRDLPDFPRSGIVFKDLTPLLAELRAFRFAIERSHEVFSRIQYS